MSLPDPEALAVVTGGVLVGRPLGAELVRTTPLRGVTIDSRRVRPGDVFFALGGRHADGHRFVVDALAAGAAVAVVSRGWVPSAGDPLRIEVHSPLSALQRLAAWYRARAIGKVVAITGSNGKTVVKDALTALLSTRYRVASSPGSWNSQIGVPLAVLAAPPEAEIGVFEAGISEPGEMTAIAGILRPDFGVLTNVGVAHIARFGARERIASEKLRLFHDVAPEGWVVLPDDPVVDTSPLRCALLLPSQSTPRIVHQRNTPTGTLLTVLFEQVSSGGTELPGLQIQIPVRTRSAPLIHDLLLAMIAARRLGVTPDEISAALQDYSFGPTRMETWRTPDGITIVNDAASADPLSVRAALETVASSPEASGRRIFVFGGMQELGPRDAQDHAMIGRFAAQKGFTHLVLLPHASSAHTAAAWRAVSPDAPVIEVASVDAIRDVVRPLAQAGDTLLVKGPRNEGLAAAARQIWESMAPRRFLVDVGAIRENIARFRELCGPDVAILAMLKAWAYGTELARVASALQESGVDWIGVSAADEGAFARRAGVHLPILVTLLDLEEVDKVVRYRLTPVVYSMALARSLADTLRAMGATCDVHIEIDTGMGRLGVSCADALAAARFVRASGVLRLTGVMTHLSSADDPSADDYTSTQLTHFDEAVAAIRTEGNEPLVIHAAATSGAARFPGSRYDLVRLGLGLYGIYPSPAVAEAVELQLAVAFVSRIAQVATYGRGQRVGYNGTFTVENHELRVGIVEAGYHDGVPWRLSNLGEVRVNGKSARIVGRVSMDSMAIDLSNVPDAGVGDEVLIFGAHDGQVLRPEAVAHTAGTSPYELLVKVESRRVQRVFIDG